MRTTLFVVLLGACAPENTPNTPGPTMETGTEAPTEAPIEGSCDGLKLAELGEPTQPPFEPGAPFTMVHGPQGGWHFGLAGVIEGPKRVELEPLVVLTNTGEQLAGADDLQSMQLWSHESCRGDLTGMITYINDPQESPIDQGRICSFAGEEVTLTVTGRHPETGVEDVRVYTLTATLDPNDVEICATR